MRSRARAHTRIYSHAFAHTHAPARVEFPSPRCLDRFPRYNRFSRRYAIAIAIAVAVAVAAIDCTVPRVAA